MSYYRTASLRSKSINILLIATIIFISLIPTHYHLHHMLDTDATAHDHVVDLHAVAHDVSHHDANTTIYEASPDGVATKYQPMFVPLAILIALLVMVSISANQIRLSLKRYRPFLRRAPHLLSPPLRAPPAL